MGAAKGTFKEALLWKKLPEKKVNCRACMRFCAIEEGSLGFCRARKNSGGKLVSLVYGRALTFAIDPIEKKPFFNFKPSSRCTSISTYGCNFHCLFCQNFDLSQEFTEAMIMNVPFTEPKAIVDHSIENSVQGISYTYNEPTVFFEYALDTMKLARKKGLYNVWVSNGYFSREAADLVAPYLDAINIDLKGNDEFYEKVCGSAKRSFVMDNIRYMHEKGVHVEVTNLIIPRYNDSDKDLDEVCSFIASVDKDMPLHFTRFFPHYKLDYVPPTDKEVLLKASRKAKEAGLSYVYVGNTEDEENSYCKNCGNLLFRRLSYYTEPVGLEGKKCRKCGAENNFII